MPFATMSFRKIFPLVLPFLLIELAAGQPLSVDIHSVDFSGLPRVSFKLCVERDGEILRGLTSGNFFLTENGVPRSLSVRCPDKADINSVVLVLDNSGSIFAAMPKLIEASKQLVDSLGPNDEAAIITFGRDVRMVQNFTTDKDLLKTVLNAMVASGGTALFDASYMGVEELSFRAGNRHAVIITDGEDNLSSRTDDEVIALANLTNSKLHTIAFDIAPEYRDLMERMAVQTGGAHFFVSRPGDLPTVYATIAALITEPCCIGEYTTADCVDTLRNLFVRVVEGSDTAVAQLQVVSPSRADRMAIWVDVPDELTPLATDYGFVHISPAPSREIALTMSFVLDYDQKLVDVPLLPFSLGTITQNQIVKMERLAPGATRFTLNRIIPALATSLVVGFPIKALVADSSRRVGFSIRDIQIEGCPATFSTATDSTLICQCFRALQVGLDSLRLYAADEPFTVPVVIRGGLENGLTMTADLSLLLPTGSAFLGVVEGDVMESGAVQWRQLGDTLHVSVRSALPRDTSGTLLLLSFGGNPNKTPQTHRIRVLFTELWQRCCPLDGELPEITVMQDGRCEFFVRRISSGLQVRSAPNPLLPGAPANLILTIPDGRDMEDVHIRLLDMQGRPLKTLLHGAVPGGGLRVRFDLEGLPAGRYLVAAEARGVLYSTPVVLLR
ncbi:MAG: VWA domain-containing protein [Bacteroidia bacterium]|nr:VWA domain-containing protein [Bacteroidia bacterium]